MLAAEAAVTLVATKLGLRLFGLRQWKAILDFAAKRAKAAVPAETATIEFARQVARLQQAAARHLSLLRTNCLEQALALRSLLQRRGIAGELRIGARKTADRFEAHAWMEVNGTILTDPGDDIGEFTPFRGAFADLETQRP